MQVMKKSEGLLTRKQIFNKFRFFNFSEIFTKLLRKMNYLNSAKKRKTYFLRQKLKKNHFTLKIV